MPKMSAIEKSAMRIIGLLRNDRGETARVTRAVSPLSFLKSPMILMALFSMALIFGMPKLMENMDPEMKQEFEEMQKNGVLGSGTTNTAQQIQNFDLASWMAGKTDSGTTSGRGQSPAGQAKKR